MMPGAFLALAVLAILLAWHGIIVDPLVSSAYRAPVLHALAIALAVALFFCVDRLLRRQVWHGYLKRRRNREAPAIIQDIVTLLLLLLGLAAGFWWVGILTLPGFVATVIAVSGAVAFVASNALQPVILDLFSGIAINFDGSYGLDDWLTIYSQDPGGPLFGRVTGITWRTTFLRLEDGTRLAVPNRLVTMNPTINHSREPHTKELSVEASVDIRVPSDRVMDMFLGEAFKAVQKNGLAKLPEPIIVLSGLSGDAATYQVRFHIYPDRIAPREACSTVSQALLDVIQQNRLPLPSTQVELTKAPDIEFDLGAREIADALLRARLFRDALNSGQAHSLAGQCKSVQVTRGHLLMTQGAEASSVFIILEGAASVWVTHDFGRTQRGCGACHGRRRR